MKIAVTSKGKDLDSQIDPRFGRAVYILIVDTSSLDFKALDNSQNVNAFKGTGIQAASMVSDKDANILLTGFCGPNAFKTLNAARIKMASDIKGTVKEPVVVFNKGNVTFADSKNTDGH